MNIATRSLAFCATLFLFSACRDAGSGRAGAAGTSAAAREAARSTNGTQASASSTADAAIPEGLAGVWVEDAANTSIPGAAEAAITLCEGGRASYAVFSNQLFIFMKATLRQNSEADNLLFYFDGEDVGSGFRNAGLLSPTPGALMATGHIEGDASILVLDWAPAADYIQSIRAAVEDGGGREIFPRKFFINSTAMAGLCEETE